MRRRRPRGHAHRRPHCAVTSVGKISADAEATVARRRVEAAAEQGGALAHPDDPVADVSRFRAWPGWHGKLERLAEADLDLRAACRRNGLRS